MGFNKDKFVFHEFFTNESGKQSGSAFIGIILGLIAGFTWVALPITLIAFEAVDSTTAIEIMKQTINLVWASAALLGARKLAGSFKKDNTDKPKNNAELG